MTFNFYYLIFISSLSAAECLQQDAAWRVNFDKIDGGN